MCMYVMQDLSVAMISQWRKEAMRSTLKTFKKTIIDADKAAKAKLVQKVSGGHPPHSPYAIYSRACTKQPPP